MLGDCIERMKELPDRCADCVICDLPYGETNHEWDIKVDLKKFWYEVERLLKRNNTPVIHFGTMRFGMELINSKPNWFHYELIWNKNRGGSFLTANKLPMKSHEMIFLFSKISPYYKSNKINKHPLSVIDVPRKTKRGGHPTEKPEELYEWLLSRYCPEGGTVLDPTAGSFNSVAVANRLGLNAIGIEKDEGSFNKAVERFAKE